MDDFRGPRGDAAFHLPLEALVRGLASAPAPPKDVGRVTLLVSRRADGVRETPQAVRLTPEGGMPGDCWLRDQPHRIDTQIAVMRDDVARLIANGQPLTVFGDNLFLDLDLSDANLPAGTRLRAGGAVLEVTPEPHDGCRKFRQRFGSDALRFTADPRFRGQHLRGIYFKVVSAGEVRVGNAVEVIERPCA